MYLITHPALGVIQAGTMESVNHTVRCLLTMGYHNLLISETQPTVTVDEVDGQPRITFDVRMGG